MYHIPTVDVGQIDNKRFFFAASIYCVPAVDALITVLGLHVHNLAERNHHEVAFMHSGMRQSELRCADGQVVVHKHVYVDRPVLILYCAVWQYAFTYTSKFLFYPARFVQAIHGRHHCVHKTGNIQKKVGAGEAYRIGFKER